MNLFGEPAQKNRRLTPKEREEDIKDSIIWDRYPRSYLLEKHFYKNVPITPVIPRINFDLNYKE